MRPRAASSRPLSPKVVLSDGTKKGSVRGLPRHTSTWERLPNAYQLPIGTYLFTINFSIY
jgi:hypothetical protein